MGGAGRFGGDMFLAGEWEILVSDLTTGLLISFPTCYHLHITLLKHIKAALVNLNTH